MNLPNEISLHACDREKVHVPGTIQPHGLLFVLDSESMAILQCSANVREIMGVELADVIGQSIIKLLMPKASEELVHLLNDAGTAFSNPLQISTSASGKKVVYDAIAHRLDDQIVVELENPGSGKTSNSVSSRSLDHYFKLTTRTLNLIEGLSDTRLASRIICDEIRAFTGFDRVMFYEFAPDNHGVVVAESKSDGLEPFEGLHYPATDIPKQARELYAKNWLRIIHDVDSKPVGLYPADRELDMSHCTLRSVSPIHIQYLKNMGVASSMSISLVEKGKLWALIACHHYSGPLFVPYTDRVSCVHFGIVLGLRLVAKMRQALADEVERRKNVLATVTRNMPLTGEFFEMLQGRSIEWRELMDADGVLIMQGGNSLTDGDVPGETFVVDLMECLRARKTEDFFISEKVSHDLPELSHVPLEATGVVVVGLGSGSQIFFFRKETTVEMRWGGDPNKAVDPAQPLTPRASFEEWKETMLGLSRHWTMADREIANELRSGLAGLFIQHNQKLEHLNRELARKSAEIEQFTYSVSHDLKSPLFTINGFVGALEEEVEARDWEAVKHCLSRISGLTERMGLLIDDLLDFSKIGRVHGDPEQIDMISLLKGLREEFEAQIADAGATLEIADDLPTIKGYPEEIFRVFQNYVENALKYGHETENLRIEIDAEHVKGFIRFRVKDNGPGIDPRYHDKIFELFQRIDTKRSGTGLGLASVAKVAQLHNGSSGVDSEVGKGAIFWLQIPA